MEREWNGHCQRCYKKSYNYTMSYFNTDLICMDCDTLERENSKFGLAQEAESNAVRSGNYNYPGIGKPSDL